MNKKIVFRPAFDKTDPDPTKNYGVSDVVIYFLLEGEHGIVEFDLHTGWYLPNVEKRRVEYHEKQYLLDRKMFRHNIKRCSFPADICRWSRTRLTEDDTEMNEINHIFDGETCFYNYKSYPAPDELYERFLIAGDGVIWEYLGGYYKDEFGELE
jgi:hypothetical protein